MNGCSQKRVPCWPSPWEKSDWKTRWTTLFLCHRCRRKNCRHSLPLSHFSEKTATWPMLPAMETMPQAASWKPSFTKPSRPSGEEGIHYGSLGVAPWLDWMMKSQPVRAAAAVRVQPPERLLWIPRPLPCQGKIQPDRMGSFLLYLPAEDPTPDMFYALVTIQNPNGIREGIRSFLKGKTS